MDSVFGLVAFLVALAGLLAAVGYGGYLLMLRSVAGSRPGASHLADDARKRLPVAGGLAGGALVALLFTAGGPVADTVGILLGGGTGLAAVTQLQAARRRLSRPDS